MSDDVKQRKIKLPQCSQPSGLKKGFGKGNFIDTTRGIV